MHLALEVSAVYGCVTGDPSECFRDYCLARLLFVISRVDTTDLPDRFLRWYRFNWFTPLLVS